MTAYTTLLLLGLLPLIAIVVDAVPHRDVTPIKPRGVSRLSSWSGNPRTSGTQEISLNEPMKAASPDPDKIVTVRSSTEQRASRNRPMVGRLPVVDRLPVVRQWRPKTKTKKLAAGRPRPVYTPVLIEEHTNMLQKPKCHMPWINELSKIQFYYDGINALCDLALTFEPCSTSGSVCRTYPVEFTCCPSTSLAVLKKCYKDSTPPDNVCLPTKIQMSGIPRRPKSRPRAALKSQMRTRRIMPVQQQQMMKAPISGCSQECSPAWIDMFSNIQTGQNDTLPVCEFLDVLAPCAASGSYCPSNVVAATCCPRKCVSELEKCYVENPPDFVCTPRTLQPWISRLRKYFGR